MPAIIHPKFIYIHVPKCGGYYVVEALKRAGIIDPEHLVAAPTHVSLSDLYQLYGADRGLPVLGGVRKPPSWYASWVRYFSCPPGHKGPPAWPEAQRVWAAGGHDPVQLISAMSDPTRAGVPHEAQLYSDYTLPVMFGGGFREPLDGMRRCSIGLCTWFHLYAFSTVQHPPAELGAWQDTVRLDHALHTEQLSWNLSKALARLGIRTDQVTRAINTTPKQNTTASHDTAEDNPWRVRPEDLPPGLVDQIMQRDRFIVERYYR